MILIRIVMLPNSRANGFNILCNPAIYLSLYCVCGVDCGISASNGPYGGNRPR
jgi:hypothetical protein